MNDIDDPDCARAPRASGVATSETTALTLDRLSFLSCPPRARVTSVRSPARESSRPPQWEHGRARLGGRRRRRRKGGGDPATLPNSYGVTFCLFTFDYTIWHTFTRNERASAPRTATAVRRARLGAVERAVCRHRSFVRCRTLFRGNQIIREKRRDENRAFLSAFSPQFLSLIRSPTFLPFLSSPLVRVI